MGYVNIEESEYFIILRLGKKTSNNSLDTTGIYKAPAI